MLAVCTGNVSRSPCVEHLLGAALPGLEVGSAGVKAVVGASVDPPMAEYLRSRGLEVDGFAARQLTADMVARADLVLALTRQHRVCVVELVPAAVRRTFTLREFARVLGALPERPSGDSPSDRLAAAVPLAAAGRWRARPHPPAEDDVKDPYGRGPRIYRRSLADIQRAVDQIVDRLIV